MILVFRGGRDHGEAVSGDAVGRGAAAVAEPGAQEDGTGADGTASAGIAAGGGGQDRRGDRRAAAPTTEAARLQQRYRLHRDSLYVFLQREDVEPTNNSSERDLRPSVIHRKGIGGFRSAWGAEASAIRTSLLATARKQGENLLDAFRAIAGPSPLQALPARA
jgi:hypothetical protein